MLAVFNFHWLLFLKHSCLLGRSFGFCLLVCFSTEPFIWILMLSVTARPRWMCICQVGSCHSKTWGSWYLCQQKKLLPSAYATSVLGRFAPQLCQPSHCSTFVSVAWQDLRVVIFIPCSYLNSAPATEGYFSITSTQSYSALLVTHIYFLIGSDKSLVEKILYRNFRSNLQKYLES